MANGNENKDNQQQSLGTQNSFTGGMVKDPLDLFKKDNSYTHARNMTNYLSDGEVGGKSAEPSNLFSCAAPYTIIGCIYLTADEFIVFSTDNTHSEIGHLIDSTNTYTTLMNDVATLAAGLSGLNFNTSNLITGQAKRNFECGFDVYWSDAHRNVDRVINTATCPFTSTAKVYPNPWIQECVTSVGCLTCTNTDRIDVEQLRLAPLLSTPCIKLSKHQGPGQLKNGSYQVCMAYAMNGIKCTDYIAFSDVYSPWAHLNNAGSIDIKIEGIDLQTSIRFTEMELVVISLVNEQVQAKKLGIYSTAQSLINLSLIDDSQPTIPIERLPLNNPIIVSCDAIFGLSNHLTRVGPKERPDINYQPLANQIIANWAAVQYPEAYYHRGGDQFGMNVGYLRGERYAFYIRWIYSTGDKSADYPIPGLPVGTAATFSPAVGRPSTQDTGSVVAAGRFAGYSSTEKYPDRTPSVWGSLCGQPIMHHEFPDQASFSGTTLSHFNPGGTAPVGQGFISVMGVYFTNIKPPVDLDGNIVADIVGYEILRAVRDGHEFILAKGMINNMKKVTDNIGTPQVLQNYPYNDLGVDVFLTNNFSNVTKGTTGNGFNSPVPGYPEGFNPNMWSFHSPDTVFNHPYLGLGGLSIDMAMDGMSQGIFREPWKHPMFKVLSDFDSWLGTTLAAIEVAVTIANIIGSALGAPYPEIQLASTDALPLNFPILANPIPNDNVIGTGSTTDPVVTVLNIAIAVANAIILGLFSIIQVPAFREQVLTVIKGLIPGRQYALQYNSFGNYVTPVSIGRVGSFINDYMYIKGRVQQFAGSTVNNLYRNEYVAINLDQIIPPYVGDEQSRFNLASGALSPGKWYNKKIGSYYASYKVDQSAQYGQVDSTKQVPIGCVQQVDVNSALSFSSPIMFGGDTYINRYTEKNPMLFFNDWLVDVPEDFKYDYRNYINVPYPMFWLNNDTITYDILGLAHENRRLDGPMNIKLFYVSQGYFYLFCNGVRDFFVESSVNVGYRDWEEETTKRFYDPYGSSATFIDEMFRSDIIKSDTLYKYDYSLSANRFINQYISWGQCLRRDYDPDLAYTCFAYFPRRVAYSLPQDEELMQDNWRLFLPNNYKNFPDNVYVIKDLHKSGAIFLMEGDAPYMFAGVETMPSKNSTEYTVGSGSLFQQTLQSVGNVDSSYEYASNQSRLGVVNTPYGIFWISQRSGKIFTLREGKAFDIGQDAGLKYWLLSYLPSMLLKQFPGYTLGDNPVAGVGCQLMYDSVNEVLYITKKDRKLKDEFVGTVFWDPVFGFYTTDGIYRCPSGYTLSGTSCIINIPGSPIGDTHHLSPTTNAVFGNRGIVIFDPGYSLAGLGTYTHVSTAFWTGRVNNIAVWDLVNNPLNVWVGFTQCFNIPSTKTYYVAVAADDLFRIKIDGVDIVYIPDIIAATTFTSQFIGIPFGLPWTATLQLFSIFPVTIPAGTHVISVQAENTTIAGMVAVEIYDNTPAEIAAAISASNLNIIFTTQGKTEFTDVGYECPTGYTLISGDTLCDRPNCRKTVPATLNRFPIPDSYFEDASWTLSYDCKRKEFISFHDWHPTYHVPTKNHLLTIMDKDLWRHNNTSQDYCSFYGNNYPCEIEYFTNTQITDTILQSIEWLLESYQYAPNGFDKFLNFDENFDQVMIYNKEQNSSLQNMQLKQWDNPYAALNFPQFIGPTRTVLYQKVENKYRLNDFYDFTADRGQFSFANTPMVTTDLNGYTFTMNTAYFNMLKAWNQQKRMRYMGTRIFMRKTSLGKNSLTIRYAATKNIYSPR